MAECSGAGRTGAISIASFNAHYGIGRDGDPFDMRAACRFMDADVIALQEVWWPDEGPNVLDEVRGEGYDVAELPQARASLSPSPDVRPGSGTTTGWWGVAIASRFPLGNQQSIDIGTTPHDPVGPRKALRAQVDIGAAGPLTVTTVHATHLFPFAPLHHRRLARALDGSTRAVVGGDFNLWGFLAGLSFRGWQRPVRGRSYPAHRPHSLIDHIFATPDLVVTRAEVLGDVGSDHRPIVARVLAGH
ncbi:MAG: Endo/exonuclease/phosphatase protein [Actinomycetota bacterium]|jgi:endonuclease/exonuclease/phosphatase family metal-dependent hydrolase|nr:Endo/exonuclease/phosphatase protein [Actinomycetota bacterium]